MIDEKKLQVALDKKEPTLVDIIEEFFFDEHEQYRLMINSRSCEGFNKANINKNYKLDSYNNMMRCNAFALGFISGMTFLKDELEKEFLDDDKPCTYHIEFSRGISKEKLIKALEELGVFNG